MNFARCLPSRLPALLAVALTTLLLAACGGGASTDPTATWSAERLYEEAKESLNAGNWNDARTHLNAIEARYPFGVYAQQALIDLAYVNWRDEEPEQALATIARFEQLYPNHRAADYMLYLKGLVTFTPASAFLASVTQQEPAERAPKGLRRSYDAFNELLERYPESRYALVNTIAMNEVYVARYYFERNAWLAAVNRAQTVITDFESAPAAEQALYIMVQAYDKLGLPDLRDDARRVLLANYPNTTLLTQGFAREHSWWNPLGW